MEQDLFEIFSSNLNRLMVMNGKSQADIANATKTSKSSVSYWCAGTQIPRADRLQMLANLFNVDLGELLSDKKLEAKEATSKEKIISIVNRMTDAEADALLLLLEAHLKK